MWIVFLSLIAIICFALLLIMRILKKKNTMNKPSGEYRKKDNDVVSNLKPKKESIFSKLFSKKEKQKVISPQPLNNITPTENKKTEESQEIEVLELYPSEEEKIDEVKDDVLDLDDLFKTISMTAINNDSEFDFGLRRSEKK